MDAFLKDMVVCYGCLDRVRLFQTVVPFVMVEDQRCEHKVREVVILQNRLFHYRVGLFNELRSLLRRSEIDLQLMHGSASRYEKQKNDEGTLEWARPIKNIFLRVKNVDLIWQCLPLKVLTCDLLVMRENRVAKLSLLLARHIMKNGAGGRPKSRSYESK